MPEQLNVVVAEAPVTTENSRRTRNGRWTLAQLRQTDGIVPLQSGTNKFDSQKGMTGFGTPRNTQTSIVFADNGKRWTIDDQRNHDNLIRLQSGTNKFESQKGMTSFGAPRDVKGKHLKRIWELEFPEESLDYQIQQQQALIQAQAQADAQAAKAQAQALAEQQVLSPPAPLHPQHLQQQVPYQSKQYRNVQQPVGQPQQQRQ